MTRTVWLSSHVHLLLVLSSTTQPMKISASTLPHPSLTMMISPPSDPTTMVPLKMTCPAAVHLIPQMMNHRSSHHNHVHARPCVAMQCLCIPCLLVPCSWSSFELRTLCSAAERPVSILNLDRESWRGRTGPEKTGVPSEAMCTTATPTLPWAQVVSHAHVSEPYQFDIAQGAGLWSDNTLATCPRTCS